MGILVSCPNGHRLNLKAELAGLRGVCPRCGTAFNIPKLSEAPATSGQAAATAAGPSAGQKAVGGPPSAATVFGGSGNSGAGVREGGGETAGTVQPAAASPTVAAADDVFAERPEARWYVRPAGGGEYGPADGEMLRQWLEGGRVAADSLLVRDDWPAGRRAADVFPARFPQADGSGADTPRGVEVRPPSPAELRAARRKARRRRLIVGLVVAAVLLVPALVYVLMNQ